MPKTPYHKDHKLLKWIWTHLARLLLLVFVGFWVTLLGCFIFPRLISLLFSYPTKLLVVDDIVTIFPTNYMVFPFIFIIFFTLDYLSHCIRWHFYKGFHHLQQKQNIHYMRTLFKAKLWKLINNWLEAFFHKNYYRYKILENITFEYRKTVEILIWNVS